MNRCMTPVWAGVVTVAAIAGAAQADMFVSGGSSSIYRYADDGTSLGTFVNDASLTFMSVRARAGVMYAVTLNNGIYRYDLTTGASLGQFTTSQGGRNYQADWGADGNLYMCGGDSNTAQKFDGVTGAYLGVFATGLTNFTSALGFGADGYLYTAGQTNGTLRRVDPATGAIVFSWNTPGPDVIGGSRGFTFSPDGTRLYITDANYGLRYVTLATNAVTTLVTPTQGWSNQNDVAFGADGSIYSLERSSTPKISHWDPNTGASLGTVVASVPLSWGLDYIPTSVPAPGPLAIGGLGALCILRRRRA